MDEAFSYLENTFSCIKHDWKILFLGTKYNRGKSSLEDALPGAKRDWGIPFLSTKLNYGGALLVQMYDWGHQIRVSYLNQINSWRPQCAVSVLILHGCGIASLWSRPRMRPISSNRQFYPTPARHLWGFDPNWGNGLHSSVERESALPEPKGSCLIENSLSLVPDWPFSCKWGLQILTIRLVQKALSGSSLVV